MFHEVDEIEIEIDFSSSLFWCFEVSWFGFKKTELSRFNSRFHFFFDEKMRGLHWIIHLFFMFSGSWKGAVHKIRNAVFRYFRPPPPFVTQNRTNPYIFTEVRNNSLTPPQKRTYFVNAPKVKSENRLLLFCQDMKQFNF
jgi:hypothetical protein